MSNIDEINELVGNKRFQEARVLTEEALRETPDNIEILKLAGLTNVNLVLWLDAKRYFETVVKYTQDDATSWFYPHIFQYYGKKRIYKSN